MFFGPQGFRASTPYTRSNGECGATDIDFLIFFLVEIDINCEIFNA
jgi:hypothetical protein